MKSILSDLHYECDQCDQCNWVDHEEALTSYQCVKCETSYSTLCDDCSDLFVSNKDRFYCENCVNDKIASRKRKLETEDDSSSNKRQKELL